MRGRLIFPFIIELAQLDTDATGADPDGTLSDGTDNVITEGYDNVFREPVAIRRDLDNDGAPDSDDTTGEAHRVEKCITLPAQIHPDTFDQLQQLFTGANQNAAIDLWLHFRDLEKNGLVDPDTGQALIKQNDRLARIFDCDGKLIQEIPDPPGLYITQVKTTGFSFGRSRNLLVLTLQEREQGTRLIA